MALTSSLSTRQASHIDRLLEHGTAAVGSGELGDALRHVDRAWRQAPDSPLVGRLLGRLLNACGYHAAASRHLTKLAADNPSPELAAEIIESLLRANERDAATERLHAALQRFAVGEGASLAVAAHRLILAGGSGIRGWVGVAPELHLIGEVAGVSPGAHLELRDGAGRRLDGQALSGAADGGVVAFRLPGLPELPGGSLTVLVQSVVLTGSGLAYPPDFALDGRAETAAGRVKGWASIGWVPDRPVALVATDRSGKAASLANEIDAALPHRRNFDFAPRALGLAGNEIIISARLPNGRSEALPDAPLLLRAPRQPSAASRGTEPSERAARRGRVARRGIDIVVPVYRGRAETLECLDALIACPHEGAELVVIDDGSPDAELSAALDRLAAGGAITLLRNERNLGFPASANRGIAHHADRDVVLLNADAVVHGDWLERLRRAAYSAPDIASVTPLTNAGSIASYPGGAEQDCAADEAARIDALAAVANRGGTTEIPVGVGFCLYLRRDCLADVGMLDADTFGSGYGEEVDFCLRAGVRGWRHLLAEDVFVRHAGGRSFGRRRNALLNRNTRIIALRYPDFQQRIEAFHASDAIAPARRRLDEARLRASPGRYVVILTLALTGGVERFVRERCQALRQSGLRPLVVKPVEPGSSTAMLVTEDGAPNDLRYDIPREVSALREMLRQLDVAAVELHHFLDSDPRLVDSLLGLGAPFDVYIHDYSWICPRLTLIDGTRRYCGEPDVAACERCVAANGSSLRETITVAKLRKRSARWLSAARQVIVPTEDVGIRLARYFPALNPKIVPWETDIAVGAAPPPSATGAIRVVIIGAIGVHKGYEILLDCARDAAARKLPLEFVVIGYSEDDEALFETGKVFVTGRYGEDEMAALLRREAPNLVFFPSIVPETWCYALTHAMRSGLPIVGFDLGAVAERLRGFDSGVVLSFTDDPAQLNEYLLRIGRGSFGNASSQHKMPALATGAPLARAVGPEIDVRSDLMPPLSAVSASVQILPVSDGLYLFSVRSAAPVRASALENLLLPAVHVGLGPGIAADVIQLIPGPRTNGAWLCEPGDMLVAKVSGRATILLTSFQSPTGQTLAIEVERLDGRVAAAPARAQSATALPGDAAMPAVTPATMNPSARLRIDMHLRNQGDASFTADDWAGRSGTGKWIEAFKMSLLEPLTAAELEYKGLTATGLETPWLASGAECGTRGKATPLVGFAVRLRQNGSGPGFDCEYSGYFSSGTIVGPLKNGAPCRSSLKNDPLEGIRVVIRPRSAAAISAQPPAPTAIGPRFSKLREEEPAPAKGETDAALAEAPAKAAPAPPEPAAELHVEPRRKRRQKAQAVPSDAAGAAANSARAAKAELK